MDRNVVICINFEVLYCVNRLYKIKNDTVDKKDFNKCAVNENNSEPTFFWKVLGINDSVKMETNILCPIGS